MLSILQQDVYRGQTCSDINNLQGPHELLFCLQDGADRFAQTLLQD